MTTYFVEGPETGRTFWPKLKLNCNKHNSTCSFAGLPASPSSRDPSKRSQEAATWNPQILAKTWPETAKNRQNTFLLYTRIYLCIYIHIYIYKCWDPGPGKCSLVEQFL